MSDCLIAELFAELLWVNQSETAQMGTSTRQAHNHLMLHMSVKTVYG